MRVMINRGRHFAVGAGQPGLLMTVLVNVPGKDRWDRGAIKNKKSLGKWTRRRSVLDSSSLRLVVRGVCS